MLERALEKLPEHQRVPLVLYHFEDMPYEDIARKTRVSLSKVKTDILRGREALAARPQLGVYINVTRGLLFNEDSVRKLLACAERGIPALWIPVTSGGTTGPITLAGTMAINTAGVLAGVVIAQLAREGAPVVVPAFGGDSLDLRTMVDPYAGPEPKVERPEGPLAGERPSVVPIIAAVGAGGVVAAVVSVVLVATRPPEVNGTLGKIELPAR